MNIAVRVPNWIGDCVMSLPALRALKDHCPRDNIIIISKPHLSEVFKNIGEIGEIIKIPGNVKAGNLLSAAGELKTHTFDAGILFTNSFNSALLFRLSGIKPLTGYNKDLRGFLLNKKLRFPGKEDRNHHIFFYMGLVEAFIGKKVEKKYSDGLVIAGSEKKEMAGLLASRFAVDLSKTIIGISPSAAYGSAKQWLPERFVELIRRIIRENQTSEVLLFGSAKEREKTERIREQSGSERVRNLAGELTLRQAITAISLCSLFVSNDSGLMHVASSLKIPLMAIFGPTLPHKTSPLYEDAKVFHHPVECAPCKHRDCPIDHRCMKAVTVDEVYEHVKPHLSAYPCPRGGLASGGQGVFLKNRPLDPRKTFDDGCSFKLTRSVEMARSAFYAAPRSGVFLDRDGTLIEDRGYICNFSEVVIYPFAIEAVRLMNENNYKVIIVTNQSAIARGICQEHQVRDIHRQIKQYFSDQGAVIDDFYYCPYHVDGIVEPFNKQHDWRKPAPGMVLQAAEDHKIDLTRSFLIGDNECDVLAGRNAGCKSILVLTGKGKGIRDELEAKNIKPYLITPNILTAAENITNS